MDGDYIISRVRYWTKMPAYSSFNEINFAFQELCRLTSWNWLRTTDEERLSFQSGKSVYEIDMEEIRRLQRVYVYGIDSSKQFWHELEEVTPQLFEQKVMEYRNADGTDEQGRPKFFEFTGGPLAQLRVSPTPGDNFRGRIDYIKNIEEIIGDTEIPLTTNHGESLALLASGYILETSAEEADILRSAKYIKRAKESFRNIVRDHHPARILDFDRPKYRRIR